MICVSCQAPLTAPHRCDRCGALQPLPAGADAFAVLGLPRTFAVEPKVVEERFKELNRKLHPDRFAQTSPRDRRLSLEWTTAVNDAARSLKDPLRRALYLLRANGIDLDKDSGRDATKLSPELLEEVMEQREALQEARVAGDHAQVRAMAERIRGEAGGLARHLAEAFSRFEESGERAALDEAAQLAARLKYHGRFLEEVEAMELAQLDR